MQLNKGLYCESRLGDGSHIRLKAFYWLLVSKTARSYLCGPVYLTFCTQELMVGRQSTDYNMGKTWKKDIIKPL